MIYLPEFFDIIQPHLKDTGGLLKVFLHFLFGDEIEIGEQADLTVAGVGTYQKVAILGYRLQECPKRKELAKDFQTSAKRLSEASLVGSFLPQDPAAMLGIALGISLLDDHLLGQWFRETLLEEIPLSEKKKGLDDFLKVISDKSCNAIDSIRCPEYKMFLATWTGGKSNEDHAPELKNYFIRRRKEPFLPDQPGKGQNPSFFQSMLSIYVMDKCLQVSVWDPQAANALRESTLAPIKEYLHKKTLRSAMIVSVLVVLLFISGMVFLTYQFFQYKPWNPISEPVWESIENALYAFGGPVSFFFLLLRVILSLSGRREITFEVETIADWIAKPRLKRRFKAMGIESPDMNL